MPRINLDLALDVPRTQFGIFNDGPGALMVTSITPETPAPWIDWSPHAPFEIQAGAMQVVEVIFDYASAPADVSQTRLLIGTNDPANPVYPGGVYVTVTPLSADAFFFDNFEN